MARPLWFVKLLKKTFPNVKLIAKMTNLPILGKVIDHLLFKGDDIIYLPQDKVIDIDKPLGEYDEVVLPSQILEYFINRSKNHWVMNFCICRSSMDCKDYPKELGCLFLGDAVLDINPQLGRLVSKEEGGFLGSIEMAEELAKSSTDTFLPRQFSNEDNIDAHFTTTGPELWWQMRYRNLKPDAFVAGVGTGGTVMGVGKFLEEQDKAIKIHPLEPANSPTMSTGHKVGKHRIQGISDEFIPSIVKLDNLDSIVSVDDGDSIIMAQKLSMEMGIAVGISSGANFLGALKIQNEMGGKAIVATVFADSNKKYLSTDLMHDEPVKEGFLSPLIQLQDFRAYKRVCHTCCDPSACVEVESMDLIKEACLPPCPRRI